MPTFTQVDSEYRNAIEAPGRELPAAMAAAQQVPGIDLNGDDISRAVLARLKSYMTAQDAIKTALGKRYGSSAADFFVETVLFYLRVALERLSPGVAVVSEKSIIRKRGALRPDISVWRGDRLVAAVECKTQLGWSRGEWLNDFERRESRMKADFPDAQLFLLVMTGSNWSGFGDDPRAGTQFFALLRDVWPRDVVEPLATLIAHRVEELILALVGLDHANQAAG
jgi:hypothetical protein